MVLYFVVSIALPQMNFQDYLVSFGTIPYGNLFRYERIWPVRRPCWRFTCTGELAAVLLAIVTNLLWVRGMDTVGATAWGSPARRFTAPLRP